MTCHHRFAPRRPALPGGLRALLAAAILAAAATRTASAAEIALVPFAAGLSLPVDIANAGDSRLFVAQKDGRIRVVQSDGTVLGTDFLDIGALVSGGFEQGLLGLAFHPNYAGNGFFYVNYTNLAGDTVIARYTASGDPLTSNVANPGSAVVLLTIPQPFSNHNGGALRFGPNDGYLYIGMGDGGSGCDPLDTAQDPTSLLGKMLRIDVDSGSPYAIPPSNPFAASMTTAHEIWALGLRNPWRFSFDRANGNLYIGDVGQNALEEIDFQLASSTGGENYGWDCYEGNSLAASASGCSTAAMCTPASQFTFPVHEYSHVGGRCSVTGGHVYRGTLSPGIAGHYFFAEYCTSEFYSLTTPDNGNTWALHTLGTPVAGLNPVAFGEDVNSEVYVGGQGSGTVYRIAGSVPPPACPPAPAAGCSAPGKSSLKIKRPGAAANNRLAWKWRKGPALTPADFGDPPSSTSYALCVYVGGAPAGISAGVPGVGGWRGTAKGFKYSDSAASGAGVSKVLLRAGDTGKSKILVKSKGANLDLSAMPIGATATVVLQLVRNDGADCWEASFPLAAIRADDGQGFTARIP